MRFMVIVKASKESEAGVLPDRAILEKMGRQNHADHDSVWTSTETTAGRSRTIGAQVSPASDDA